MQVNNTGQVNATLVSSATCLQHNCEYCLYINSVDTHNFLTIYNSLNLRDDKLKIFYCFSFLTTFVSDYKAFLTLLRPDPGRVRTRLSTTISLPGCRGCSSRWDRLSYKLLMRLSSIQSRDLWICF